MPDPARRRSPGNSAPGSSRGDRHDSIRPGSSPRPHSPRKDSEHDHDLPRRAKYEPAITREDVDNAMALLLRVRIEKLAATHPAAVTLVTPSKDGGGNGNGDKEDNGSKKKTQTPGKGTAPESEKGGNGRYASRLPAPFAKILNNTKIGKEDTWNMIERFFPETAAGGSKGLKTITAGKEEVSKDQLVNLLVNRAISSHAPFDEAYQFFVDPEEGKISKESLKRIAKIISPYGLLHKGDISNLMNMFDRDEDGTIGLEDFKRMSLPQKDSQQH
ncbi:hypothetical protein BJ742DRAFT_798416 [Cladochytrium replicatum]|nr:hypothetical protein BJ742DRAFT_798416 [Cladochytrium replicatum]